jgi:hypothetical protein
MLTNAILPSPNDEPAQAVAWYLTNPLLVAANGAKLTTRAAKVAAGEYEGAKLHKLAVDLYCERNRLRLSLRAEADKPEEYDELRGLLQSKYLTQSEKKDLGYRIRGARPSEYTWLRKPIEKAICTRAEQAASRMAVIVRNSTIPIVPASQLAAGRHGNSVATTR